MCLVYVSLRIHSIISLCDLYVLCRILFIYLLLVEPGLSVISNVSFMMLTVFSSYSLIFHTTYTHSQMTCHWQKISLSRSPVGRFKVTEIVMTKDQRWPVYSREMLMNQS